MALTSEQVADTVSSTLLARRAPLCAALSTSTPHPELPSKGQQGPTSIRMASLLSALPRWPSNLEGTLWARIELPPYTAAPASPRRAIAHPLDFKHFTPEGLDVLARILRRTIERNRGTL